MAVAAVPAFGGLKIEQVAGVHAALHEKIPLERVLDQEQIEAATWPTADKAWREVLAKSPDLQLQYAEKLRAAEDALGRPCPPYDDDPAAWAGLTAALALGDGVNTLVDQLGLSMTDFGRLGRAWRRKAAKDPEVAKKIAELVPNAPAPKPVTLKPVELKPFPWSPKAAIAAAAPTGLKFSLAPAPQTDTRTARLSTPIEGRLPIEVDLDLYAAFTVVLELAPTARARALALLGVASKDVDAIDTAWRDRLKDPAIEAELVVKKLDHRISLKEMMRGARPILA